jgi:hypothetical protein
LETACATLETGTTLSALSAALAATLTRLGHDHRCSGKQCQHYKTREKHSFHKNSPVLDC